MDDLARFVTWKLYDLTTGDFSSAAINRRR